MSRTLPLLFVSRRMIYFGYSVTNIFFLSKMKEEWACGSLVLLTVRFGVLGSLAME